MEAILEDDLGKNIKAIHIESLNDFVVKALKEYGTTNKLNQANQVWNMLEQLMKKKHIYNEGQLVTFYEIVRAATLLHNLFYEGTITSLFMAREKLTPLAKECGLPEHDVINPIFELIEGQLGADTPVPRCVPTPNHPQELLALACWLIEELHGGKKMPAC